jgi:hypothetical protein
MAAQATFRITKELKEFQDRPDPNLFVCLTRFTCNLIGGTTDPL